jgi:hypothetical protein
MEYEWRLNVTRVNNGYRLSWPDVISNEKREKVITREHVIEDGPDTADDPEGKIESTEKLLWFVIEHFAMTGSKHDPVRLSVERVKREE